MFDSAHNRAIKTLKNGLSRWVFVLRGAGVLSDRLEEARRVQCVLLW